MRDKQNKWKCVFTDAILGYAKIWNYDEFLQTLCDVWKKVKEVMRKFAERLRELFGSLSKVVEPGKPINPIKVTDYRCHRDFYVREEYTYIPIFRRNMPYHRRNF